MNRLYNLDYLRGAAAFGIMIYHYFTWVYGVYGSETFLGRLGLYGVSIFYVLSGLTLYFVYFKRMEATAPSVRDFFIKRAFRIMPLLWLAISLTYLVNTSLPKLNTVFWLNITGLFGIIDCNISIARGGWSIGNEIAFYLFFPFFVILSKWYKVAFYFLCAAILTLFVWFAFYYINSAATVVEEWPKYINPLNQVFLFLSGYLLGYFFHKTNISNTTCVIILALSVLCFIYIPVHGDRVKLITGYNRLLFSLFCIAVCFSLYKFKGSVPVVVHKPLAVLGETSYSVYLLHPIVFAFFTRAVRYTSKRFFELPDWSVIAISIPCTLAVSYLVYQTFEKYFMRKGKEVSLLLSGGVPHSVPPLASEIKSRQI